ncbi:MAG: hypothetical protein HYR56_27940 [Acidobacteria bacterium]|nr:hypothetical protein [Acidobacteriota bacterium]MBI3426518.1 hypothetical protein [Acidobacteriota bacterium]
MTRTTKHSIFWSLAVQSAALLLLVGALSVAVSAQPNTTRQPTGVRNSCGARRLNANQLQVIQQTLRQKTGFSELAFDAQGGLTLGDRQHLTGGSATARALLVAAVESANLYELESHENSPAVAFARINETEDKVIGEDRQRVTIFQVQLDFADFDRLGGAREAKASFDVGIALLHELVHGVLNLTDPRSDLAEIGPCDARVNQMRRELQLPERLYYHPNIAVVQIKMGTIVVASLEFIGGQAQATAKYRLSWRADQVSPAARNIAQLQQGLVAPVRR